MEQVIIQQRPLIIADLQNEIRSGEWGGHRQTTLLAECSDFFPLSGKIPVLGWLCWASSQWGMTPSLGDRAYLSILLGNLADRIDHEEAETTAVANKTL